MPIDNFLKILEEISLKSNKIGWRFTNKPKNILFLYTKRKENICDYVNISSYNIFEYLIKGEIKKDLIFELNLLCLNNHIDVIFCKQDTIDLAKELNNISLGRRGLLKKEIIIVCEDKV